MNSDLTALLISSQAALVQDVSGWLSQAPHRLGNLLCVDALDEEFNTSIDVCMMDASLDTAAALELTGRLRSVQPLIGLVVFLPPDTAMRLKFLSQGADHVLGCPPDGSELLAVLQSLSRHIGGHAKLRQTIQTDAHAIELDSRKRCIRGALSEIHLTSTEFSILQALSLAKNKELELWQIYDVLGKTEQTLNKAALEAQIYRLRKKLKDCGAANQALRSMRLKGYQLCCPIYIS